MFKHFQSRCKSNVGKGKGKGSLSGLIHKSEGLSIRMEILSRGKYTIDDEVEDKAKEEEPIHLCRLVPHFKRESL